MPFAIGLVAGPGGTLWQGAAGEAAPGVPAAPDTVLRLFSMTKAVGAVAAAILVERGAFGWDDPVGAAIPAFDALPGPRRLGRRHPAPAPAAHPGDAAPAPHPRLGRRLRHLAPRDRPLQRRPPLSSPRSGRRRGLDLPLAFDPGTGWAYGTGLDWAGLLIEAVDGRPPDAFVRDEILAPLGMDETVFELPERIRDRLANAWVRTADGLQSIDAPPVSQPEFWGLGHALTGTGPDYLRFLRMLLSCGALDGTRVLSAVMVDALLAARTGPLGPMPSLNPAASATVIRFGPSTHSLLGVRTEAAIPGRRAAGAQGWGGLYNTHWWLDPAEAAPASS